MCRQVVEALMQRTKEAHEKFYGGGTPDQEMAAMYMLEGPPPDSTLTMVVIGEMPEDPDQRTMLGLAMAGLAKEHNTVAFSFSCEAWTIPPEAAKDYRGGGLSQRLDRIEVLSVEVGSKDGTAALMVADIKRSTDNPPVLQWRDPVWMDEPGMAHASRFNIFNPQVPDVERARREVQNVH